DYYCMIWHSNAWVF
nr:immunoglobulin light chain junction region [Macaca mulatta]MOY06656.1 immunoglobulin light chain junction region [Macaca mulatta]MOY09387.1 immunoglobulin light chain junction region [Macaca mulatta]